ncbi:MAG: alpha/beta fold hydrolase [Pirellulales bacterium]
MNANTVTANDVAMAAADEGQGPAVLLVHGFPLNHTMWVNQIEALSATHRVIAPDLRGFGASAATEGVVTMEQFADDLAAMLDALAISEPVTLCGLSMGGYVAFEFWRKYAPRVRALILCDTRAAADAPEAARLRLETADRVLREGPAIVAQGMVGRLFWSETQVRQPEVIQAVRRMMLDAKPAGIAAALRGMAARSDSTGLLAGIRVPTLVVVGQHDIISPVEEMRTIAGAIPGARLVRIAQAGHMAPMENPAAVNAAVARFLTEVRTATGS